MGYNWQYLKRIKEREVLKDFSKNAVNRACFLCAEARHEYRHRRILAGYLKKPFDGTEMVHLWE